MITDVAVGNGDSRRADLLEAARSVLGRQGYHASKVSDIVRQAGVAQGTFYRYFASKEEAFLELSRAMRMSTAEAIEQADDPSMPFAARLTATVHASFACVRENSDIAQLLNFGYDAEAGTPEAQAEVRRNAPTIAYRTFMFEQALERDEISACDPAVAALLVTGAVRSALMEALVLGDSPIALQIEDDLCEMLAKAFAPARVGVA